MPFLAFSQSTGPQLAVGPGVLFTAAGRTNNVLAGNPDNNLVGITPSFNGVAFFRDPISGPIVYISNATTHQVFKVTLVDGQASIFAGNGTSGNTGDGGAAVMAQLSEPSGLATDTSGNLYIADTSQNVVRKVDTSGIITRVAGNGIAGGQPESGDGGPATSAQLGQPIGIAVDATGNIYIADSGHHRIREVTSGIINVIAGNGVGSYSGDGAATGVSLNFPSGVAVDTLGKVYIADTQNQIARVVVAGNLTTIAGTHNVAGYSGDNGAATSAQLNNPYGIGVDAGGAVYVSETANNVVRRIGADSLITTIAGNHTSGYTGDGGVATAASLNGPSGVTVDRTRGSVYFVDFGNLAIRTISSGPAGVTFPLTANGSSAQQTITLSNTGDQSLSVTNSSFPSGFTLAGGSCASSAPTIPAGQSCTMIVQFSPTSGGPTSGTLTFASNSALGGVNVPLSESNGLRFVPVSPCRVIDTRGSTAGAFGTSERRDYDFRGNTSYVGTGSAASCATPAIPATADVRAYSLNLTVVPQGQLLYLTAFPNDPNQGSTIPNVSNLNSFDGRIKANAAIVPVSTNDANRRVSIFARNPTNVVVDLNGYYIPETDTSGLAYYPLPPCRAVDTRRVTGTFGGPTIRGKNAGRVFPLVSSSCGLPSGAKAYSVNVTAVPRAGGLDYLTLWPSDQNQPFVSTLNSPTGTVVANAAVIPAAADGSISAYATDNVDLLIDVNGYYAPYQAGGLFLYNVAPCRAYDTRGPNLTSTATVYAVTAQAIAGSSCAPSAVAQSYLLNTTVLPTVTLTYMTNWAAGTAQPLESTLNAYDVSVSSNLAVVPTIDGRVFTYTTSPTGLILDLFGYFAP